MVSKALPGRVSAVAGIVGPFVFAAVVLLLSIIEYPFMRSLGWDPISRPTYFWPSGLALGPLGIIMTVTFVLVGGLLVVFGLGLRADSEDGWGTMAALLLSCAGAAMSGLAFTTDRVVSVIPISWHGRVHDLSFMALGMLLIPAMILFGISFLKRDGGDRLGVFTWLVAALAIPAFALKGPAFYAFLVAILSWTEWLAVRLWRR